LRHEKARNKDTVKLIIKCKKIGQNREKKKRIKNEVMKERAN
jgi:hypothetical protein